VVQAQAQAAAQAQAQAAAAAQIGAQPLHPASASGAVSGAVSGISAQQRASAAAFGDGRWQMATALAAGGCASLASGEVLGGRAAAGDDTHFLAALDELFSPNGGGAAALSYSPVPPPVGPSGLSREPLPLPFEAWLGGRASSVVTPGASKPSASATPPPGTVPGLANGFGGLGRGSGAWGAW
jgi:hypothetical protein